ncbi:MAG: GNAT family N-acetyltransferase [Candidatus Sericytochromatia bacterium]
MSSLSYIKFAEKYKSELTKMIFTLYEENIECERINNKKIDDTIAFLNANPSSGTINMITINEVIIGYFLIVNYWSNEFGGQLAFIDELFIKEEYRSKNYGSEFIKLFIENNKTYYKAIFLEVFPSNKKAYNFYMRNGFIENEGKYLIYKMQ